MAGSVGKILVVVGIHEGNGFPSRTGHLLTVEARLAGEVLETDPVEHGARVDFSTELAWETSQRSLQQHRLKRTPIKLVCFAIDKHSGRRQEIGYILLDLRSAQQRISTQVSGRWHALLNCLYSGKKPELRVSLTIETDHPTASPLLPSHPINKEPADVSGDHGPTTSPVMVLDERGGWYLIGSPSPQQILHTISLTLSHPRNLHMLLGDSPGAVPVVENGVGIGPYHFFYVLLGNEIHTEPFSDLGEPCNFQAERASVRVKATPTDIHTLLSRQPEIEIVLCSSDGTALGTGHAPVQVLSASSSFSLTCTFAPAPSQRGRTWAGPASPTIDVTLQVHVEEVGGPVFNDGGASGLAGSIPLLHASPQARLGQPTDATIPGGFAIRNLAQSFEDASNSSGHSSSLATGTPPPRPLGQQRPQQAQSRPSVASPFSKTAAQRHASQTSPPRTRLPPAARNGGLRKAGPPGSEIGHLSPSHPRQTAHETSSALPIIHITDTTIQTTCTTDHLVPKLSTSSTAVQSQSSCSAQPTTAGGTVVTTGVPVARTTANVSTTTTIVARPMSSTSATTAVTQASSSVAMSTVAGAVPSLPAATVVGHAVPGSHPLLGGVPLVATMPPTMIPTTVHLATGGVPTAHLATTDGLPMPPPPVVTVAPPTIAQQQMEYQAAMELEMWKISQEQRFLQSLKDKEEKHMKILGEEFHKRDQHREELLKQKLDHYQLLETQLAKTLSQLEKQRVKLREREEEIRIAEQRIAEEKRIAHGDLNHRLAQLQNEYETRLEVERIKSSELSSMVDRLKKRVREVEEHCSHKEAEFDALRQQLRNEPESQFRAQTSLLQVEKLELQHKLDSALKSKQHYKQQWTTAIQELAALKQREQGQMREKLRQQQRELESMREQCLVSEEQQSLQKQLADLRNETHRLQSHTLAKDPHSHSRKSDSHAPVDSDIARWIEERDILLQTGVYSSFDPTIQKLDQKIRDALAGKTVTSTTSH